MGLLLPRGRSGAQNGPHVRKYDRKCGASFNPPLHLGTFGYLTGISKTWTTETVAGFLKRPCTFRRRSANCLPMICIRALRIANLYEMLGRRRLNRGSTSTGAVKVQPSRGRSLWQTYAG